MLKELNMSVGQRVSLLKAIQSHKNGGNDASGADDYESYYEGIRGGRGRSASITSVDDSVVENIARELSRLHSELSKLKTDLTPVWLLVKEYKQFQSKTDPRAKGSASPLADNKSGKSPSSILTSSSSKYLGGTSDSPTTSSKSGFLSSASPTPETGTIRIYFGSEKSNHKTFRVTTADACSKILPAVLKKNKVEEPWQLFALNIKFLTQERKLNDDEYPLELFNRLNDGTRGPIFILKRKDSSPYSMPSSLTPSSSLSSTSANKRASSGKSGKLPRTSTVSKRTSNTSPMSVVLGTNEAIAILPYTANMDDEFNVEVGDRFIILKRFQNWFLVRRKGDPVVKGVKGLVPSGCLRVGETTTTNSNADNNTASTPTTSTSSGPPLRGTVLYDYKAGSSTELSVKKGDGILIYKKADHWLYAESAGDQQKGWVPESYVSIKKGSFSETPGEFEKKLASKASMLELEDKTSALTSSLLSSSSSSTVPTLTSQTSALSKLSGLLDSINMNFVDDDTTSDAGNTNTLSRATSNASVSDSQTGREAALTKMLDGIKSSLEKWMEHAQEAENQTPSSGMSEKVDHLVGSMKFVNILADRVHVISASKDRDDIFAKLKVVAEECVRYTKRSLVSTNVSPVEFFRAKDVDGQDSEERVFLSLSAAVRILM
ncbi:Adaptor for signal transduction [Chytridiales sp. JEL 0842]|nr:Adaptor for signal transduction [Chytridiales sp. JEL 0842]